jgi:hypothetical protein
VLIGGMPAATAGDACTCTGPPDVIVTGSCGVLIGGKPAARMGDTTAHGGVIVGGCGTVLIGERRGKTLFQKPDIDGDADDDFVMPPDEERAKIITETIKDCIEILQRKLSLLSKSDSRILRQFKNWFGLSDEMAIQIITGRIERTLDFFMELSVRDFEIVVDEEQKRIVYATIYGEDEMHTVFLGDKFWGAGECDGISKAFVLIHEASHLEYVGGTRDFDYGKAQCLYMAKHTPGMALYNADSFAYFIEV